MDYRNNYDDYDNKQYGDNGNFIDERGKEAYPNKRVACIDAMVEAFERMHTLLFSPFDFGKWFFMGFTAWLMLMFEGGMNFSYNVNNNFTGTVASPTSPNSIDNFIASAQNYIDNISMAYWVMGSIAVLLGVLLVIALGVFVVWIRSRGAFMFLDNVVMDRGEVKKPWAEFKELGWSAFKFNIFCTLVGGGVGFIISILLGGAGAYLIIPDLLKYASQFPEHLSTSNITGIVLITLAGLFVMFNSFVWWLVMFVFKSFCVPIMYKEQIKSSEAFDIFKRMLKNNKWNFTRYLLVYALTFFLLSVVVFAMGCLTFCIGFLIISIPVIGTIVLLPIPVIFQYYNLEILAQIDEAYQELLNKDIELDYDLFNDEEDEDEDEEDNNDDDFSSKDNNNESDFKRFSGVNETREDL